MKYSNEQLAKWRKQLGQSCKNTNIPESNSVVKKFLEQIQFDSFVRLHRNCTLSTVQCINKKRQSEACTLFENQRSLSQDNMKKIKRSLRRDKNEENSDFLNNSTDSAVNSRSGKEKGNPTCSSSLKDDLESTTSGGTCNDENVDNIVSSTPRTLWKQQSNDSSLGLSSENIFNQGDLIMDCKENITPKTPRKRNKRCRKIKISPKLENISKESDTSVNTPKAFECSKTTSLIQDVIDMMTKNDENSIYKRQCFEKEKDLIKFQPTSADDGDEILIKLPRCMNLRATIDLTSLKQIPAMAFSPALDDKRNHLQSLSENPSSIDVTGYDKTTTATAPTAPTQLQQQQNCIPHIDVIDQQQNQGQIPFLPSNFVFPQSSSDSNAFKLQMDKCFKPLVLHENEYGFIHTCIGNDGSYPISCIYTPKLPSIEKCTTNSPTKQCKSRKRTESTTSKNTEVTITSEGYNNSLFLNLPVGNGQALKNCDSIVNNGAIITDMKANNSISSTTKKRGRPYKNGVSKAKPQVRKRQPKKDKKSEYGNEVVKRMNKTTTVTGEIPEERMFSNNNESYLTALDMPVLNEDQRTNDINYEDQSTAVPFEDFLHSLSIDLLQTPPPHVPENYSISIEQKDLLECFNNGEVGKVLEEMNIGGELIENGGNNKNLNKSQNEADAIEFASNTSKCMESKNNIESLQNKFIDYCIGDELIIENFHNVDQLFPESSHNQSNIKEIFPITQTNVKSHIIRNFQSYINDHSYSIVDKEHIRNALHMKNQTNLINIKKKPANEILLNNNENQFPLKSKQSLSKSQEIVEGNLECIEITQLDNNEIEFSPELLDEYIQSNIITPSNKMDEQKNVSSLCLKSKPQSEKSQELCSIQDTHEESNSKSEKLDQHLQVISTSPLNKIQQSSLDSLCLNSIQNSSQHLNHNLNRHNQESSSINKTSKESKFQEIDLIKNKNISENGNSSKDHSKLSSSSSILQESDFLLPPLELDSKLEDVLDFELSSLSSESDDESDLSEKNIRNSKCERNSEEEKLEPKNVESSISSDSSSSSTDSGNEILPESIENFKAKTTTIEAKKSKFEKTGHWPTTSDSSSSSSSHTECASSTKNIKISKGTHSNEADKVLPENQGFCIPTQQKNEEINLMLEINKDKDDLSHQNPFMNKNPFSITESRPTTTTTTINSYKIPKKLPQRKKSDIVIQKLTIFPPKVPKVPSKMPINKIQKSSEKKPIKNNQIVLKKGKEIKNKRSTQELNENNAKIPELLSKRKLMPEFEFELFGSPNHKMTNISKENNMLMNVSKRISVPLDPILTEFSIENPFITQNIISPLNDENFLLANGKNVQTLLYPQNSEDNCISNELLNGSPTDSVEAMAKFFNITCFPSLIQKCPDGIMCLKSHNLRDADDVREAFKTLNPIDVDMLYKFVYKYKILYTHYYNEFCYYYAENHKIQSLNRMLIDGQRYQNFRANKFIIIYNCLMDCGLSKSDACKLILNNVSQRTTEVLTTILNIIVDSDWTLFPTYVRQIIYEHHNIILNENTLTKMAESFIKNPDYSILNIFLNCIFKLDAALMHKIQGHPALQKIISTFAKNIPNLCNNTNNNGLTQ